MFSNPFKKKIIETEPPAENVVFYCIIKTDTVKTMLESETNKVNREKLEICRSFGKEYSMYIVDGNYKSFPIYMGLISNFIIEKPLTGKYSIVKNRHFYNGKEEFYTFQDTIDVLKLRGIEF